MATAAFVLWSLIAYRATATARQALESDGNVDVTESGDLLSFVPRRDATSSRVALLFLPGALVDPIAYAPLARAVAAAGFVACIVRLPRRGAFGGADSPELFARIDSVLSSVIAERWVVAGHSRGGVVTSSIAARRPQKLVGIVLIGTSHPRDVNLRDLPIAVAKIVGTHDGLASRAEVEANAALLPSSTEWTWVEGGNHSQFAWYGFQPGDRPATVSREAQQGIMIEKVVAFLRGLAR